MCFLKKLISNVVSAGDLIGPVPATSNPMDR